MILNILRILSKTLYEYIKYDKENQDQSNFGCYKWMKFGC